MTSPLFSATQETYSDILPDFDIHPVKKDIVRLVDEAAVKRALRNLLVTRKTSRFFNVNLGTGIYQYLFELMSPAVTEGLRAEIEQTITNYEPRVNLLGVDVQPDYDHNSYNISIYFTLLNKTNPLSLSLRLDRVR